ncbi:MAG: glycosyltransferase family 2 protein [Truepera sp.]|nr:glycosyltransferase family 2 protein [Truepera sp.]
MLIPAYNEEAFVAAVVKTATASGLGPVLVVDDGSEDGTASVARQAQAEVLSLSSNCGKGGAVFAGAAHLDADVLVLIDADLTNLRVEHLRQLAEPVLRGQVDMARGVFVGGRWSTEMAQKLAPQLSGQRAVLRARLLEVEGLKESRYGVEIAITKHAKRANWRIMDVPLSGVSQVIKEEKRGLLRGLLIRLKMYGEILWTWLRSLRRS